MLERRAADAHGHREAAEYSVLSTQFSVLGTQPLRVAARTTTAIRPVPCSLLLALCLLLSVVPLRADTLDPFAATPAQAGPLLFTAKNWAGYVAEVNFGSPVSNTVTSVSGAWTVPGVTPSIWPAANVSGQQASCVTWVGIDGFSNNTVEQIGIESNIENGLASYYAWYEMYPNGLTLIPSMSVSPGDSITASVQYSPPGYANEFQLSISDSTNGQTYTTYQTNSSALRSSAEWIIEAPTITGSFAPLPTFGSVTFTGAGHDRVEHRGDRQFRLAVRASQHAGRQQPELERFHASGARGDDRHGRRGRIRLYGNSDAGAVHTGLPGGGGCGVSRQPMGETQRKEGSKQLIGNTEVKQIRNPNIEIRNKFEFVSDFDIRISYFVLPSLFFFGHVQ